MDTLLIEAGLTELQAAAYLFLLEHGESAPPKLSKQLKMTRSNAYKVLDSLQALGLANKREVKKKYVYRPADPTALAALVAEKRNSVIALEQNINTAMQQLRAAYRKSSSQHGVDSQKGKEAMMSAYENQIVHEQPIYFVKTQADIPFMGFEAMDRLRRLPATKNVRRFGITPDAFEGPASPAIDARANLRRTWIDSEAYSAPVEWGVSGNQLLIQVFVGEGRVISIDDAEVAESFRQLWHMMDSALRSAPDYKKLPRRASRRI